MFSSSSTAWSHSQSCFTVWATQASCMACLLKKLSADPPPRLSYPATTGQPTKTNTSQSSLHHARFQVKGSVASVTRSGRPRARTIHGVILCQYSFIFPLDRTFIEGTSHAPCATRLEQTPIGIGKYMQVPTLRVVCMACLMGFVILMFLHAHFSICYQ